MLEPLPGTAGSDVRSEQRWHTGDLRCSMYKVITGKPTSQVKRTGLMVCHSSKIEQSISMHAPGLRFATVAPDKANRRLTSPNTSKTKKPEILGNDLPRNSVKRFLT